VRHLRPSAGIPTRRSADPIVADAVRGPRYEFGEIRSCERPARRPSVAIGFCAFCMASAGHARGAPVGSDQQAMYCCPDIVGCRSKDWQ